MRVGLYSDDLYPPGQVGTGGPKYVYYLLQELPRLGVDVVRLRKGDDPADVDVLHDPHAPWNTPLRPRRPLVITVHDLTPFTHPRYYGWWPRTLYARKLRYMVGRAKRILADSRRTHEVLDSLLRPTAPVDVVPLGVEDRFRVLTVDPPGRPFLVQVGIHRRIKEPMATLRAFEAIADRIPHELHFVGGPIGYGDELKAYAAGRPALRERVKVYWPGEDGIPALYNQASLVVHPCPEEGFGFVPLEALACGAHVLARAPAVRETLGNYGCYFEDERDLPARVLECLSHPPSGSREERSRHARQYTFRAVAEATLRAYEAAAS